jgi:spore coat polysaccharide biosynthesis protein SpsF
MKIGAIIQARTTSTRLPGKVLKELPYGSGITVLGQVIRRLGRTEKVDEIAVATTTNGEDDSIEAIAGKERIICFRGSEKDVLSRYYHCAKQNDLEIVVRITSDCPCVDPGIIDDVAAEHVAHKAEYTSNTLERTYPHGLDVEVFSFDALERTFKEAREPFEREHVTPYLYRSGKFKIAGIEAPPKLRRPDIRVTLDTLEDYALLCAVYDLLYIADPFFGARLVVDLFEAKPWLRMINEKVIQKKIFNSLDEELAEAEKILALQDLFRARDYIRSRLGAKQ